MERKYNLINTDTNQKVFKAVYTMSDSVANTLNYALALNGRDRKYMPIKKKKK